MVDWLGPSSQITDVSRTGLRGTLAYPRFSDSFMTNDHIFEHSLATFRDFLTTHACPSNIMWLFQDNAVLYKRTFFHCGALTYDGLIDAKHHCRAARKHGYGCQFICVGHSRQVSYCYVWIPADDVDAAQSWLANGHIKYSLLTSEGYSARSARDPFTWAWVSFWGRRNSSKEFENIPHRIAPRCA